MRAQLSSNASHIALITFFALLIIAYWLALPGPFLLDDYTNLAQARVDEWSFSALIEAGFSNASGPLGRPVAALTFALNYLITGDNTLGFKVTNLAIHAANSCLVFLLLQALARQVKNLHPTVQFKPRHLAFAVAVLWALHPLHVSTVMYVVQRMTLLSTFFVLASMNCYVQLRIDYHREKKLSWALVAAFIILGILGVFSKENAALLLVYLAVMELTVLGQIGKRQFLETKVRIFGLVSAVAIALMCVYPTINAFEKMMSGYDFRSFSLKERLLTQPSIVVDYLGQTLFPRIDHMGLYFDDIEPVQSLNVSVIWYSAIILLLIALVLVLVKSAPLISFGIGLFLSSHIIESTFLPLELKFEHRNYIGSIGILLAVTCALGTTEFLRYRRFITYGLFISLTASLAAQTHLRSHIWKNELSFNNHEVVRAPDSKRARSALAVSLSRAGRTDDALAQVQIVILQNPVDTFAPIQLFQICALASTNCNDELSQAISALNDGTITKDTVSILGDLVANSQSGLIQGFSEQQLADLLSQAATSQHLQLPVTSEARLLHLLSEALLETREHSKATKAIQRSASLVPKNLDILIRAAEITAGVGSIQEAEDMLNRVNMASPDTRLRVERTVAVKKHLEERRRKE